MYCLYIKFLFDANNEEKEKIYKKVKFKKNYTYLLALFKKTNILKISDSAHSGWFFISYMCDTNRKNKH